MTRTVYHVDVDRVVVTGADAAQLGAGELRALVASAVAGELASGPLPAGRAVRASLRLEVSTLAQGGAPAVASAVAAAISHALGGGRARG